MNIYLEHEVIKTKCIGRGSFTKAYRAGDIVYLVTRDWTKEAMSLFCEGEHLPKIDRLDSDYRGTGRQLYRLPYYETLKPTHVKATAQWRQLLAALGMDAGSGSTYYVVLPKLLKIENKTQILSDLEQLLSVCSNYHANFGIEFPRRNLKVDTKGNLILLDVVFERLPKGTTFQAIIKEA